MRKYSDETIGEAKKLRALGKTYQEIRLELNMKIPKSTLSEWCSKITLPPEYVEKIIELNKINTNKARVVALVVNKVKREKFLEEINNNNLPISLRIEDKEIAKIALAMLCLGEASKSSSGSSSFYLGNSDPKIIRIFLELLKQCFPFNPEKVRATIQCRADQDLRMLEQFWITSTRIPKRLFYKPQIDPRTIGKPTKKKNYKGVLRIDYLDSKVWLELESLAELIYNQLSLGL
ncbi:MAG TPA: hypothetical protein VEW42_03900 [Candidatus Eisenbacteria bacterium]|nr:hypothetical protein [Candidatus Eisenbacteria bacterium]